MLGSQLVRQKVKQKSVWWITWMEWSTYDWTVSHHGLVVRMLAWNARGIGFDPHWGLYTFQSYCLEMFKRVNANLFSKKCFFCAEKAVKHLTFAQFPICWPRKCLCFIIYTWACLAFLQFFPIWFLQYFTHHFCVHCPILCWCLLPLFVFL